MCDLLSVEDGLDAQGMTYGLERKMSWGREGQLVFLRVSKVGLSKVMMCLFL